MCPLRITLWFVYNVVLFMSRPNSRSLCFCGLNLQEGSPGINNGIALGSSFVGSINSVGRPAGNGWDIGAYEYYPGAGPSDQSQDCSLSQGSRHSQLAVPLAHAPAIDCSARNPFSNNRMFNGG